MKSITLVTCGLIGALNLAGCSRKSPQAGPAAPEVLVIEAATRDVPAYREWIGTIDGSENADIRARVTGYLIKRNYNEGSFVKKGDVLFEIDARPFEAALAQASSQLDEGKAAALTAATDRVRYDKLFAKKVISAQEHTNKTQTDEANKATRRPGYKPLGTGRGAIVSPLCSRSIGAIHARATQQTLVTSTSAPETAIHSQA